MPSNCNRKNPLTRSGTHQAERHLAALDPAHFRVDERSPADLILFAARYSRHLNYYALPTDLIAPDTIQGDWQPFFNGDIAAILAGLSKMPVTAFQEFARNVQGYLAADANRAEPELFVHFTLLFHLPLMLLQEAGNHFDRLPRNHPLHAFMVNVVGRDMAAPLEEILAYYQGALALVGPPFNATALVEDLPLDTADYNTTFDDTDPRIQLPSAVTPRFADAALSQLAVSAKLLAAIAADWATLYAGVTADTAPYEDSLGGADAVYNQIFDALTYNLLDKAVERLFQALQRIALEAEAHLQASLTTFAGHTPHYALWLTFLRLFDFSQAHLNTMTQRHLDYYYQEVLQLCRRRAQPNQVHLLFELSKNSVERLLPATSTFFRAGKDASGKEVQYQLDEDFVVNRANVATLKSLFQRNVTLASQPALLPISATVTNSSDGLGKALPREKPQWRPFGPLLAPAARLGFALADRQLFLREGERTITLTIATDQPLPAQLAAAGLRALLSGEEGWLEPLNAGAVELERVDDFTLIVRINLSAAEPAVVPYDLAIHTPAVEAENFDVAAPVLKIEFAFDRNASEAATLWQSLGALDFKSLDLQVSVTGVRNVSMQNEAGTLDPSKPFLPFGPTPTANTPLILGSNELFSKELNSVTLQVEWAEALTAGAFFGAPFVIILPSTTEKIMLESQAGLSAFSNIAALEAIELDQFSNSPTPSNRRGRMRQLLHGMWNGVGGTYAITLFSSSGTSINIPLSGFTMPINAVRQTLENEIYSPLSQAGFIKIELQNGFDHAAYLDAQTLHLIAIAKGESSTAPLKPFTPKINEFSLSYTSRAQPPAKLFHLHPFGFKGASSSAGSLLPKVENEGELYLGIAGLAPPQRLTLLFQVVDGTANPLKEETTLQWAYLRGDEWVNLPAQALDDKSNNLTGSGIVGIAAPADADTSHTVLPGGLHWFRLSASQDSDALNDLLSIDAQAASATFIDQENDPQFLANPLAAGAIAKLKTSDAAVKKIVQPYSSFGGKPMESADDFTLRASERLRHKDRAVTMWDYEHLILQEFPRVYKVRCINHTELVRDVANNILADNEVKPGHVLVVTIPNVQIASALDPLRPYTDKRTLGEIDRFLRQRISPFVQLEVQNPKFEEVQVKFKVAFGDEIADISFYLAELNAAIVRYLSPWAYDEGAEISFGGKWHKSSIIDFVEEQSYVDYIKDFEMYHNVDIALKDNQWVRIDEEVVKATVSRSILVSHPTHIIAQV